MSHRQPGDDDLDERRLRIARDIADRTPIDWGGGPKEVGIDETSGLFELERLAAAHAQVAKEFDETLAPPDPIGTLVAHYRILDRIGSGSMGIVYRARDERLHLDRIVALKRVHPERSGDASFRQILVREARIACSFAHPNVATIFEVSEWEGRVFIAMEYVEGSTLSETIQGHPLTVDAAVDCGIQIASALEAAHEAGIVHRDLKSNNVVLTPAGLVKVLDFGIAVRTGSGGATPSDPDAYGPAGWTAGTLPYMAPECLRGEPPDRRCDIWALGVTLYEALAGKRPFAAASRAELERAIERDEPPPLPGGVPPQLRHVVERCLQKNPGRRFQRAGEVRAALEAIRDGRRGRHAGSRALWGGAVLLLAALAVIVLTGRRAQDAAASGSSLLVLPAHNASGDTAQQYLADGLTDELINTLMRLSSIRVLSRQSSTAIAREPDPLPVLARRHSFDLALESSVVQSGGRVRVNVALMQALSDRQIWSRSYERPARETMTLDREIVRGVAGCLKLKLTPAEIAAFKPALPVDQSAYQQYVLGRNFAAERDYRRAVVRYERAIALDSTLAAAYSGLAQCTIEMLYYRDTPPEVTLARAEAAARRALAIDSTEATAHIALAFVHGFRWDWRHARAELEQALADEPGSPEAWYGWSFYQGLFGQTREEVDAMERTVRGDPLSLRYGNELGLAYLNAGRLRDAEAQFLRVKRIGPSEEARRAEAYRARCFALRGNAPAAIAALRELERAGNALYVEEELAYALARAGRGAEALRKIRGLVASADGAVSPLAVAATEVAAGDNEAAIEALTRACDEHDSRILWVRVDQRFDPIRKDPRYTRLLERMTPPAAL